jgi:hypothetical protein
MISPLIRKENKDEAVYGFNHAPRNEGCAVCRFFIPKTDLEGECERVYGKVHVQAFCMNFKLRRPRVEWREAV